MSNAEVLAKAATDWRWFIETFFFVLNKDSQKVPFLFNRAQADYWLRITARDIILKARKEGFSTIRLIRMIVKCILMRERHCVIVSHEEKATMRLLERALYLLKNCAFKVNFKATGNTIYFPDTESKIWIGTAGSRAFGRGDDITDYHLSEYAFWTNPGLLVGIEEACMNDAEGCIETTANGWGTVFHKMWLAAESKQAQTLSQTVGPRFYFPHFYGWFWDANYSTPTVKRLEELNEDEKWLRSIKVNDSQLFWRRLKIESMSDSSKFPQEYPATPEEAFLVAGMMVFDARAIRAQESVARAVMWQGEIRDKSGRPHLELTKTDPVTRVNQGHLMIWVPPKKGHRYVMPGDVAAGIEISSEYEEDETGCYSVWDVFDVTSWEQVAQWRGLVPPDEFGEIGVLMGMLYNEAVLAPEVNNHGLTTCKTIEGLGYRHLYERDQATGGSTLGFFTSAGTTGTRGRLINAFRSNLKNNQTKINSPFTFSDMRSFVKKEGGKVGPQPGAFSDCVISGGIGQLLLEEEGFIPESRQEGGKQRLSVMNRGGGLAVRVPQRGGYG